MLRAARSGAGGRGQAAVLPVLAREVLSGMPGPLAGIVVTVGPGSFTGLRTALALAHGIGISAGVAVTGVTVGAALADAVPVPAGWALWAAIRARSGHVFLEMDGVAMLHDLAALPVPAGPVLLAGNGAASVVDRLGDVPALLAGIDVPDPIGMWRAACRAPRPAEPLYVEAPRTTRAP